MYYKMRASRKVVNMKIRGYDYSIDVHDDIAEIREWCTNFFTDRFDSYTADCIEYM